MALKKEYGARFAIPFFERVDIHPIGLGKTKAANGFSSNGYPFLGS